VTLLYPEIRARWASSRQIIVGRCSWKNCHIPHGTGDHKRRKILCWWRCVGSNYVWWLGNFCCPPCPWIFAFLLVHEFLWYCCIPPCEMHFLFMWDDDAKFCNMMHVNCGFPWIWMLDLISVNLVIFWLLLGCRPWWCQILAGSRMQPASRQQVTVGVAYVSVTGVN
jgi:hypothetical protein